MQLVYVTMADAGLAGHLYRYHHLRHQALVARLGAEEAQPLGLEIDKFDHGRTFYILAIKGARLLGGLRLYPTTLGSLVAEHAALEREGASFTHGIELSGLVVREDLGADRDVVGRQLLAAGLYHGHQRQRGPVSVVVQPAWRAAVSLVCGDMFARTQTILDEQGQPLLWFENVHKAGDLAEDRRAVAPASLDPTALAASRFRADQARTVQVLLEIMPEQRAALGGVVERLGAGRETAADQQLFEAALNESHALASDYWANRKP